MVIWGNPKEELLRGLWVGGTSRLCNSEDPPPSVPRPRSLNLGQFQVGGYRSRSLIIIEGLYTL